MLHTLSFDEVSSPDVNLQADATAADPMVDGRMFRGSDAWRLLASLQGSLPKSEESDKGHEGPTPGPKDPLHHLHKTCET